MPLTFDHESLVALCRNGPRLAPALLASLGHDLRVDEIEVGSSDLGELRPTERRADLVLHLRAADGASSLVVEVQLAPDEDKRYRWPQYLCSLRAASRQDVRLLVLTLDASTAAWARREIRTGQPGFDLRPLVIGPTDVPAVTDAAAAAALPELAVLSALVHASGDAALPVARAALDALVPLDRPRAELYADIVLWALHQSAPGILEILMNQTREYKSEFARHYYGEGMLKGREEGREEGKAQGRTQEARTLLARLMARRFGRLPAWVDPILNEASLPQLEAWADGLFDASSPEALLGRTS